MDNQLLKYKDYVPFPDEENRIMTIEDWMEHFNCISFQYESGVDTDGKYTLKEFQELISKLKYAITSDNI